MVLPVAALADAGVAAADVLDGGDFQTEFPGEKAEAPEPSRSASKPAAPGAPDTPSAPEPQPEDSAPAMPEPAPPEATSGSGMDLGPILLVAALAGLVVLGLYLFAKRGSRPASRVAPDRVTAAQIVPHQVVAHAPKLPPGPIDEAERLAAAGRYGEAIHLILLRFLADMRHMTSVVLADSSTSREILRSPSVPAALRDGLATLVGAVELCHFGGHEADQKLFDHCAAAYRATQARAPSAAPAGHSA